MGNMSVFHSLGDAAFHGESLFGQLVPLFPPPPKAIEMVMSGPVL
jgi:hypothetical protein